MIATSRLAVLMDGGYVQKRLRRVHGRAPTADEVVLLAKSILADPDLSAFELFRIFFYDAPPYDKSEQHPLSKERIDFGASDVAKRQTAFLDSLRVRRDFAVRSGRVSVAGWKLRPRVLKKAAQGNSLVVDEKDLTPDFKQKEVDLKIGLDIAWISLKGIAGNICLVAGDSDFVPAMKFARREGVRVYLQTLGQSPYSQVKEHADVMLEPPEPFRRKPGEPEEAPEG